MRDRIAVQLTLCLALVGGAARAAAQVADAEQLDQLASMDAKFRAAKEALPADEGRKVLETLEGWRLDAKTLDAGQRVQLLRCYIYAHLTIGDARSAAAKFADLSAVQPDAQETAGLGRAVGLAAGDARLAAESTRKLEKKPDEGGAPATRLRHVGRPVPEAKIEVEGGEVVSLPPAERTATIVFLWNSKKRPGAAQIEAMRRQADEYKGNVRVQFVSVIANSGADVDSARQMVGAQKFGWPHHFESKASGSPLTHKTFQAGGMPTQYVVDADGIVRAVGELGEIGLEFATRAVAAEAEARFAPPDRKTLDGKAPKERAAAKPPKGENAVKAGGKEKKEDSGELRNDPDAEARLREGRLAMKTGQRRRAKEIFEEIVRNYPGTVQAREAQSFLNSMP